MIKYFLGLLLCVNYINAQIITTVAGNSSISSYGDGGQATVAGLGGLGGVTFDALGNLYIVAEQNSQIRKVNTAGIITTCAGTGTMGFSGDGGQATAAELFQPSDIAVDTKGNVYLLDASNLRIRKINTLGIISTIAGGGTANSGQATNAYLANPYGLAIDNQGNVYFAEADSNRIRKINTSGILSTIAGNGVAGFSGDGGQATAAEINFPEGVAIDILGNIYISDNGNSCVRKVNTSGIITTIIGNRTFNCNGDGGQATIAQIASPKGIAIDSFGNIYVCDGVCNKIRKVNTAGIIITVAGDGYGSGTGTGGFSGDGGQATAAELNRPYGIALDGLGNLYIGDTNNKRVRKVTNAVATDIKQNFSSNEKVTIYPNPSNGDFIVESNTDEKQVVKVFDLNGKLVLNQIITGKTTVDASNLENGIYNLCVYNNNIFVSKKLVLIR